MRRYYIILLFAQLSLFSLTGCDEYKNSAEESGITYLPLIKMEGETDVVLDCESTGYEDPGAVALEGGEEIPMETSLTSYYFGSSTIDGPDSYDIAYSAVNKDDIPGSAFRHIYWPECNGDLVNSIAGVYISNVLRNGVKDAACVVCADLGPIMIKDLGNNQYQLSDAIGGFYDFGRGYGPGYASTGMIITANSIPGNNFTYGDPVPVGAFGGLNTMTGFTVNAATKTIKFTTDWDAGYEFEVTLTQVP